MSTLDHFSIPFKGLKNGLHEMKFEVNDTFFEKFENAPLNNGSFTVDVHLDKKSDHSEMRFQIFGHTATPCDRCLANIDLPVNGNYRLIIKYGEEEKEEAEVIYISHYTSVLNIAQYVYEFICISVPMVKVYECDKEEPLPCDLNIIEKLSSEEHTFQTEKKENNPLWDSLKKINFNR